MCLHLRLHMRACFCRRRRPLLRVERLSLSLDECVARRCLFADNSCHSFTQLQHVCLALETVDAANLKTLRLNEAVSCFRVDYMQASGFLTRNADHPKSSAYAAVAIQYDQSYNPPRPFLAPRSFIAFNVTVRIASDPLFVALNLTHGVAMFGLSRSDHFSVGTLMLIAGAAIALGPFVSFYQSARSKMLAPLNPQRTDYAPVGLAQSVEVYGVGESDNINGQDDDHEDVTHLESR